MCPNPVFGSNSSLPVDLAKIKPLLPYRTSCPADGKISCLENRNEILCSLFGNIQQSFVNKEVEPFVASLNKVSMSPLTPLSSSLFPSTASSAQPAATIATTTAITTHTASTQAPLPANTTATFEVANRSTLTRLIKRAHYPEENATSLKVPKLFNEALPGRTGLTETSFFAGRDSLLLRIVKGQEMSNTYTPPPSNLTREDLVQEFKSDREWIREHIFADTKELAETVVDALRRESSQAVGATENGMQVVEAGLTDVKQAQLLHWTKTQQAIEAAHNEICGLLATLDPLKSASKSMDENLRKLVVILQAIKSSNITTTQVQAIVKEEVRFAFHAYETAVRDEWQRDVKALGKAV